MRAKRTVAAFLAALVLASTGTSANASTGLDEVLFVGNNWDGTVDVVSPHNLARIKRINVIPDLYARLFEIHLDPIRAAYFYGIRQLVGEGHDQYVDDMYSSPDGRLLVVSRPSFGDVVALDIASGRVSWRFKVDGYRADHMAMSPDGRAVAVSASTGKVVHVLEVATGRQLGKFGSGDSPHENVYSRDGRRIFHASIGNVYTPLDLPWLDSTKGLRYFQIVDAVTYQIIKRIDMRTKLDEAGYTQLSSAVRPMTFSPDERFAYFQVSFHHGFVEYDLTTDRVTRVAALPDLSGVPRSDYLLDSAHHGIAMNPQGTRVCVAGTMSDYVTVVDPTTFGYGDLVRTGTKPYWVTGSADGRYCYVSWSGSDRISAISYETGHEVMATAVGDHPQRMRLGSMIHQPIVR